MADPKLRRGNLKPAPFALTPGVVRALLGDGPPGSGIALIPIEAELRPADGGPLKRQLRLPMHPIPHVAGEPSSEDPTRPSTWAGAGQASANDDPPKGFAA